jgi:predicted transcriptional regulator
VQGDYHYKFCDNTIILFNDYENVRMQRKRRDREEIMYKILSAARQPATRTRLIYASFLSSTELRQYITILLEHGMLEVDPITKTRFKVTEEGRKFIGLYEDMIRVTRSVLDNNNLPSVTIPARDASSSHQGL